MQPSFRNIDADPVTDADAPPTPNMAQIQMQSNKNKWKHSKMSKQPRDEKAPVEYEQGSEEHNVLQ